MDPYYTIPFPYGPSPYVPLPYTPLFTHSFSRRDKFIIAHATFAGLAVMILAPIAIISGRFLPRTARWFYFHAGLQFCTISFLIIAFSLGTYAVSLGHEGNEFSGGESDTHHKLGLACLIFVLVVAIIGGVGHRTKSAAAFMAKSPVRLVHMSLGLVTMIMLYAQVREGFKEWDKTSFTGRKVPVGVKAVYGLLLAVEILAYIAGIALAFLKRGPGQVRVGKGEEKQVAATPAAATATVA